MAALPDTLEALLLGTKRSIEVTSLNGGPTGEAIIPDVVVSEMHSDEVTLTKHPVDTGAQITDHAYAEPAVVVCTFGWSDSSRLLNAALDSVTGLLTGGDTGALGGLFKGEETTQGIYEKLLELQKNRTLLKLSTKKRVYDTVIIRKLETTTTVDTENALLIEVTFEEVITAKAKTVALAEVTQADASRTASTKSGGQRQAQQASLSLAQGV